VIFSIACCHCLVFSSLIALSLWLLGFLYLCQSYGDPESLYLLNSLLVSCTISLHSSDYAGEARPDGSAIGTVSLIVLSMASCSASTILSILPLVVDCINSGYCEGELCPIESAVGADYIVGGKMRQPLGGTYSRMLPEVADEASERAVEAPNGA
jgi:hypothetical protein